MRYSFKTFFFAMAMVLVTGGQAEAGRDHDYGRNDEREYQYGDKVGECRDYQQAVYYKGRQQFTYGTACLRRGGNWEVVSSSLDYEDIRTAGPVIILPERKRYNDSYVVIQDRPGPTVIYKESYRSPYSYTYRKPYHARDERHAQDCHNRNHSHDLDNSHLSLNFNW